MKIIRIITATCLCVIVMPALAKKETITCVSINNGFTRCDLPNADMRNVHNEKTISGDCSTENAWGVDSAGIWVDKSCGATFQYSAVSELAKDVALAAGHYFYYEEIYDPYYYYEPYTFYPYYYDHYHYYPYPEDPYYYERPFYGDYMHHYGQHYDERPFKEEGPFYGDYMHIYSPYDNERPFYEERPLYEQRPFYQENISNAANPSVTTTERPQRIEGAQKERKDGNIQRTEVKRKERK